MLAIGLDFYLMNYLTVTAFPAADVAALPVSAVPVPLPSASVSTKVIRVTGLRPYEPSRFHQFACRLNLEVCLPRICVY